MKNILMILLLIMLANNVNAEKVKAGIFKFINKSDYRGNWDLEEGVTKLIWEKMANTAGIEPKLISIKDYRYLERKLPDDMPDMEKNAEVGKYYGVRYVVGGEITEFEVTNFGVVSPRIAGYSSYSVKTEINYFIVDTQSWESYISTSATAGKIKEREIATIFLDGGAWGSKLGSMEEFNALKDMTFGSAQWRETKVGEAILSAVEQIKIRLKSMMFSKSFIK